MIIERNKISATVINVLADKPDLSREQLATAVAERLGLPTHMVEEAIQEITEYMQ